MSGATQPDQPQPLHPANRRLVRVIARKPLTMRRAAQIIASFTITMTLIGGVTMHFADERAFPNVGDGLWWSVQTVTTVGYGDLVPTTTLGRIVAALVMLVGIAFLTVVTATITSTFIESARRRLEGVELVFAERIAADLAAGLPPAAVPVADRSRPATLDPEIVAPLQRLMSARAGVLRSGDGLAAALDELAGLGEQHSDKPSADAWEATNLHLVATAIAAAALSREETRGSHWREDFPDPRDAWRGHLVMSLGQAGLAAVFEPDLHG